MVCSLEECLLNIEDAINIKHWHKVQGSILQQIHIEVIIVQHAVQELEYDVKRHLDGNCFPAVMGASDQNGGPVLGRLTAHLDLE